MVAEKLENLAGYFILLTGWQRNFAAFLAGLLLVAAMPPFDLVLAGFVSFPILVWLVDGVASEPSNGLRHRLWMAFNTGFFFGFGFFLGGLWWVGNALLVEADRFAWAIPFAVIALPAFLSIFWGFAVAAARLFWRGGSERFFVLAAFFALFEFLRGTIATGFPWNTIGYAAYFSPMFMQSASILGIYGITAFTVFSFSAMGVFVPGSSDQPWSRRWIPAIAAVFLVAHAAYGYLRLPHQASAPVEEVMLRLVQPAVEQKNKWDPAKETEIFNTYLSLSTGTGQNASNSLADITHLIWPESAFPFLLTQRKDALAAIAAMLPEGTSLITGAARAEAAVSGTGRNYIFNSVYIVDHNGEIISAADKVHLVPFGEYLPLQEYAEALGFEQLTRQAGGFEPGSSRKLLSTGIGPALLPLVCYEIIFSDEIWNGTGRPGWILNLTNDAWFGKSPGPYQHLRFSLVRGVEEGLPVVRVANTGISVVSDAYGRIQGQLELGTDGILDANLPTAHGPTVFSRFGTGIFWAVFFVFLLSGLTLSLRRRGN